MNRAAVIETSNLVMRFPQQQGWHALFERRPGRLVLDNVNLMVQKGEIFGLLGPNGAGKTTLVKILSTLLIPTTGKAYVTGLDVVRESGRARRKIGVVYGDERILFWRLSAFENLLFYASLYGIRAKEARRRVSELLELVGLSQSAHVRIHHYSSGMKQRASIARSLLNDPDLLILDEANRALDPVAASELRRLIKERVADGRRTVLVATNVMAEAEYLCDRVAFINHGRIQMIGEIDRLREALQTDEAYQIVVGGLTYASIEALRTVPGVDSLKVIPAEGGRYRLEVNVRSGVSAVPVIIRRIVEDGGDVWSCSRRKLTLEEMFAIVVKNSRRDSERETVSA